MKVNDVIEKVEKDLTTEELVDLIANHNRQVDLIFAEKKTDEDGYLTWDLENWTSVDGKRFIRSYGLEGRMLSDYSGYNKYDLKGCFQPETWDFSYGEPFTQDVIDTILHSLEPAYVAGLTLLGAEPFEPANHPAVADLLRQLRASCPGKNVWAFTGFLLDRDLLPGRVGDAALVRQMLGCIDVLVDGRFMKELKDISLQFRGSRNQRVIDMNRTRETGTICIWDKLRR